MKRVILLLAIFFAIGFTPTLANIIHIPGDYETIQEGIDASADGDTVLVQPGTYLEIINFSGHNIVLGSLFLMTGDTTYISETIIDGNSSGPVVTFESGEDRTTILTGFTIRDGYNEWQGGGIYCRESSPTITNNLITSNLSPDGAGIYCHDAGAIMVENVIIGNSTMPIGGAGGGIMCIGDSTPVIANNYIGGNQAVNGGGIHCDGNAIITGNNIVGNVAVGFEYMGSSGGINCSNSSALIAGNTISNNSAGWGGGIGCYFSNLTILNNVFNGNEVSSGFEPSVGGGIYCYESSPVLINNSFTGNKADLSGGGIYCALVSNPVITNTIFWGDSASYSPEIDFDDSSSPYFTYCDIQGGWAGEGNIDILPLFHDPPNRDYHLMSIACGDPYDSPCIDAGDPSIFDYLLDCDWGLGELRSDMGAFGGQAIPTDISEENPPSLPIAYGLFQNYPNPFNAATTLSYLLPQSGSVTISIYNLLGQRVATIFEGDQQAGEHTITWNAADFPSGVYFARLEAGGRTENVKMVLLK